MGICTVSDGHTSEPTACMALHCGKVSHRPMAAAMVSAAIVYAERASRVTQLGLDGRPLPGPADRQRHR